MLKMCTDTQVAQLKVWQKIEGRAIWSLTRLSYFTQIKHYKRSRLFDLLDTINGHVLSSFEGKLMAIFILFYQLFYLFYLFYQLCFFSVSSVFILFILLSPIPTLALQSPSFFLSVFLCCMKKWIIPSLRRSFLTYVKIKFR